MNKRRRYKAKARRAGAKILMRLSRATNPYWANHRFYAERQSHSSYAAPTREDVYIVEAFHATWAQAIARVK